MREIKAEGQNGNVSKFKIEGDPDKCPVCHKNQVPEYLGKTTFVKDPNKSARNSVCSIRRIYMCTNNKCREVFLAGYTSNYNTFHAYLRFLAPKRNQPLDIPEEIEEVSPDFVEIYSQSLEADASNLTQIVGGGLRKAVEFLIKDFLISRNPSEEEKYKNTPLRSCIKHHVNSTKIQKAANNAAILGNDEVHYERHYKNQDINDMKKLVKIVMHWVEDTILTESYAEEIEDVEGE